MINNYAVMLTSTSGHQLSTSVFSLNDVLEMTLVTDYTPGPDPDEDYIASINVNFKNGTSVSYYRVDKTEAKEALLALTNKINQDLQGS